MIVIIHRKQSGEEEALLGCEDGVWFMNAGSVTFCGVRNRGSVIDDLTSCFGSRT